VSAPWAENDAVQDAPRTTDPPPRASRVARPPRREAPTTLLLGG